MGFFKIKSLEKFVVIYPLVLTSAILSLPGVSATYRTIFKTENISAPASMPRSVECKLGDALPSQIASLLSAVRKELEDELYRDGVDVSARQSPNQLEQIANESLPYIASVLGHSKVYRPNISLGDRPKARPATYIFRADKIKIIGYPPLTLTDAKFTVPHEIIHSQFIASNIFESIKHAYSGYFFGLLGTPRFDDETFVEVVTAEVLAKQALNGDKVAKYAFAIRTGEAFRKYLVDSKYAKGSPEEQYFVQPARIVFNVISCKTERYMGVKPESVRGLLQKENTRFKEIFHPS